MGSKLVRSLVAGAALLGLSSTVSAAFFYIPLYSGARQSETGTTALGSDPLVTISGAGTATMLFNIPTTTQNLRADVISTPTQAGSTIQQGSDGIGTTVASCGPASEVDNCGGIEEGIRFTLTAGPIVGFRLAAIQFYNVDSNDDWALAINGTNQALSDADVCTTTSTNPCWVRLLPVNFTAGTPGQVAGANGSAALTIAANDGITSTSFDVKAADEGSNVGDFFLGDNCSFTSVPCDDWKIKAIVWEVLAAPDQQSVPEPGSMALLGAALLGLGLARRRSKTA